MKDSKREVMETLQPYTKGCLGVGYAGMELSITGVENLRDELEELLDSEISKAREEGYKKGLVDLHNSDIYQQAVCWYGEWSKEDLDEGFEKAKKDLLSKLS